MLDFIPEKFKNAKEKRFYINCIKDELDIVEKIFSKNKSLKKSSEGKTIRGWKSRCKLKLKELGVKSNANR
jgi:hypothetical protein